MYGNNHIVGCLDVSASLATIPIVVDAKGVTSNIIICSTRLGLRPKITCGIVCSIGSDSDFIVVQEGDIELDYKGTAVSVSVEANTNWIIK